jgi:hypothetical protein
MTAFASDSKLHFSQGLLIVSVMAALAACSSSDKSGPSASAGASGSAGTGSSGAPDASSGSGGTAGSASEAGGSAGVGGSAGAGAAGASSETMNDYAADDPNILYSGRIDFTTPTAPLFSAPAVTIWANFHGDSLAIKINDPRESGNPDYFDVIVDDQPAVKIRPTLLATKYPVAVQLSDTDHTVVVTKRTEASVGYSSFLGFSFGGHILPPPSVPAHKIEIIGDSISAGAGMEAVSGSPQCNETFGEPYQNGYLSYGAVAARALNAEWHITAVSGIGLIQNYSQSYDARPMPQVYDLLNVEQNGPAGDPSHTADQLSAAKISPLWDTTKFMPEAVVIGLGTNDFSPGDGVAPPTGTAIPARMKLAPADFATRYEAFIEQLRSYYPDADYFCLSSPLLGDGYPTSAETYATDLNTALADMATYYSGKSDTKVHTVMIDKIVALGCGHPNVAQQAAAGAQLQHAISAALGW